MLFRSGAVSYTHLDVYKRQPPIIASWQSVLNNSQNIEPIIKLIWTHNKDHFTGNKLRLFLLL